MIQAEATRSEFELIKSADRSPVLGPGVRQGSVTIPARGSGNGWMSECELDLAGPERGEVEMAGGGSSSAGTQPSALPWARSHTSPEVLFKSNPHGVMPHCKCLSLTIFRGY